MIDETDKELPSSDEAEQACLGSVILDNENIDLCIKWFGPDDVYNPINRRIYRAMIEVKNNGSTIDPVNIQEVFKTWKTDWAAEQITVSTIVNLTRGVPLVMDFDEYGAIIRKHSVARQAILLTNTIQRDLLAGDVPAEEVIARLEQKAIALSGKLDADRQEGPTGFIELRDMVDTIAAQFEGYNRGEATGVKSGIYELDHVLDGGGLQRKGTYIVGGHPKSGKTSLALGWCREVSVNQGLASLIVTGEMSKETLFKRLYSQHTGIPFYMFRPGFYDTNIDNPYTRAMSGLKDFAKYPIKITDNLFSIEAVYRHCAKQVELGHKQGQIPIGLIMLDYLQLFGVDDSRATTVDRVTKVSRLMKVLASDLDVPVVIMSNLNRTGMSEEGREPDIDNLRDSGSIAYDAEAVMFVHNPAYKPGKPYEQKPITDMLLLLNRQRNGPSARIPLKLIGPYMQFVTETEFNKSHSGPDNLPLSKGQLELKEQEIEDNWDI